MFADAAREVRQHPGRVVATLVAIAISIGFMAAVSIFVATQTNALGRGLALTTSTADVVANVSTPKTATTPEQVRSALTKAPGVTAVEQSISGGVPLSTDKASVYSTVYATPSEPFRWSTLAKGAWPTGATDIALSQQLAGKLGVDVGQTVQVGDTKLTVTGVTNDAPSLFLETAYSSRAALEASSGGSTANAGGTWLVKTNDPAATIPAARAALVPLVDEPDAIPYPGEPTNLTVTSGEQAQRDATTQVTGDFDVMKYLLWVFSGIAALVGVIIISNTFTILLAQRRRQIGLLRAVGASGAQVRRRFLAEAVILGAIGSLAGLLLGALIAWVGASFTKATYWGLSLPWTDLAVEFAIGVVLTVLAAMLPSLRATRVAPLEALQPVATSEQERRTSIVRLVLCGLLALAGLALGLSSLSAPVGEGTSAVTGPVARALVGSLLLTLGVLFGAPLYIPLVLRALGKLFGLAGPTARLAAANSVRNPRRASATATALMLACGLIVTLQVGTATAQATMLKQIAEKYPVDVSVQANGSYDSSGKQLSSGFKQSTLSQLQALPNVGASAVFSGGDVQVPDVSGDIWLNHVAGVPAQARTITDTVPATIADGQVVTNDKIKQGTKITLKGNGHSLALTSVPSAAVDQGWGLVSPATLSQLVAKPRPNLYWAKLANRDDLGATMTPLQKVAQGDQNVLVSGSAAEAFMITKVLDILLMVTTALLGAAVLIALIGVSNTLALSVVERARESALLRALGMQKASLRLMLLVEALMLALAGVLVGLVAGSYFGWLGIKAIMRQADVHGAIQFGMNLPMTLGLVAVAVLAAALASILPGRRAANATPTEALAEQ